MTEKDEKDKPQENFSAPDDDLDSLSEDEKAAFEKILAEINAGEYKQEAETKADQPSRPADADTSDEQLTDDQQAALDKIMAEINAGDQLQETDAGAEQKSDTDEKKEINPETQTDSSTLSLDEFNDELDNLLSKAQKYPTKEAPAAASSKETGSASKQKTEKATAAQAPETPTLKYGPAPQPIEPSSTDPDADPTDDPTGTQTGPMEKPRPAYAVLQEIDTDQVSKNGPSRKARQGGPRKSRFGRFFKITTATVAVMSMAGLIFWGLNRLHHRALQKPATSPQPPVERSLSESSEPVMTTDLQPAPVARHQPVENSAQSPRLPAVTPLGSLKLDLAAARERVDGKIEEIANLIAYYQDGIQEEHHKILTVLQDRPIPSLEKALTNSQIELSIRAIQRRRAYISKLGTPLEQLKASSEELLFLERRAQLFETLSQWVSGLSMPNYKQEIANRIQIHMKVINELSVDNNQMDLPSKASVWDEVKASLEKGEALAAHRLKTNTQDKLISQEICSGEFDRKYLLTHLSEETATCLTQWSGKDLYLNGLTELSPRAARILAQWPGEWLSLNGIKELSAETAKYLSQWPGRRLSLNGLEKLPPQATAELSRWKGEQLEMIGLTSIGPWENYATRLYLSETMRRKLQM